MRIISLVPSITETLVFCDVQVVGRSRFCIHPANQVKEIPKVGGTKDIDWEKVKRYRPDLIVLDKEENTLEMATSCPFDIIALHITSVENVGRELKKLALRIANSQLEKIAFRWQIAAKKPITKRTLENIPGVIQWWNKPTDQTKVEYLIWRDPWMAIGKNTFIQSMLIHCGLGYALTEHQDKYPEIELTNINNEDTLLLFSSEPYPFERHRQELLSLDFSCALIDGEKYSWYGIRSLCFLESLPVPLPSQQHQPE